MKMLTRILLPVCIAFSLNHGHAQCLAKPRFKEQQGLEFIHSYAPPAQRQGKSSTTWRVAYLHQLDPQPIWLRCHNWHLQLEFSVQQWRNRYPHDISLLTINPVFQYRYQQQHLIWYAELGIGLAYSNTPYFLDRNLGSKLLFEDKVGLGVIVDQRHKLGFSYIHYSNANLANPNDGADTFGLVYGYLW